MNGFDRSLTAKEPAFSPERGNLPAHRRCAGSELMVELPFLRLGPAGQIRPIKKDTGLRVCPREGLIK